MNTPITPKNAFLPLVGEALLHRGLADICVVTLHPEGESVDLSHGGPESVQLSLSFLVMGDGGDKLTGSNNLKIAPDFGIHSGAVDNGSAFLIGRHCCWTSLVLCSLRSFAVNQQDHTG